MIFFIICSKKDVKNDIKKGPQFCIPGVRFLYKFLLQFGDGFLYNFAHFLSKFFNFFYAAIQLFFVICT